MNSVSPNLPNIAQEQIRIGQWLQDNNLADVEVDCAIAVMLKILDGKCKMPTNEKVTMEALYTQVKTLPSCKLGEKYHQFIAPFIAASTSSSNPPERIIDEDHIMEIYEMRVLAETEISRPVMKKFKARLRKTGLLPKKGDDAD